MYIVATTSLDGEITVQVTPPNASLQLFAQQSVLNHPEHLLAVDMSWPPTFLVGDPHRGK